MSDLTKIVDKETIDDSGISSFYIDGQLKTSYLDYAMTVIVNRALPNFFDGCKPVQRRILYTMAEAGYYHSSPYKKCVSVVGNVLAKYHPHGQTAVYEALVRMAQPFSLNVPLIDGQGNFGSIDGDPAAADRYTGCRLTKIAKHLIEDYDKDTVLMVDNFDQSLKMPVVLPAGFPNLLVNGAYGIAVGMSTAIPPHNLAEVVSATCALIENPDLSLAEILQYIKGPDLPTGGIISAENLIHIYDTGRGSFLCRGVAETQNLSIIISEIPFQLNKSKLVQEIIELAKNEQIPEISEVRDESSLEGIRIVIDLKRGSDSDLILRKLYAKTSLETSISVQMLALQNNQPRQFSLLNLLKDFIDERENIIINRTKFYLKNAKFRAHILRGHALAIHKLNEVINAIKSSSNKSAAIENLRQLRWNTEAMPRYESDEELESQLSDTQIKAILEIRLQSLTTLEQNKISDELKDLNIKMKELKNILDNRDQRYKLMKVEMTKIKEKFATERKTEITQAIKSDDNSLCFVKEEDCVITLSNKGFIKMTSLDTYKTQNRGGKGKSGEKIENQDEIDPTAHMIIANTHDDMIVFTNQGIAYSCKVSDLPQSKKAAIVNLITLPKNSTVAAMLPVTASDKKIDTEKYLLFVTSSGHVRLNSISDFIKIKSNGKKAIPLNDEDGESLSAVRLVEKGDEVLIAASNGKAVRFNITKEIRVFSGRDSKGVKGMSLENKDRVVSVTIIKPDDLNSNIMTVTAKGLGKISKVGEYRLTSRGTKGVIVASVDSKTGPLVAVCQVTESSQVLLMGSHGQTIRCNLGELRVVARNSKGVHMIKLQEKETVEHVFVIPKEEGDLQAA